jgi:hypothetical protein
MVEICPVPSSRKTKDGEAEGGISGDVTDGRGEVARSGQA